MFDSMLEFKKLSKIRWTGDSIPDALWDPRNYGNTTLERVELVPEKGIYSKVPEVGVLTKVGEHDRSIWRLECIQATPL